MDTYMKSALEIVKAQAQIRSMTDDELTAMVASVYKAISQFAHPTEDAVVEDEVAESVAPVAEEVVFDMKDVRASVKERYIMCLECGKKCKFLTRKHLATHGLDPVSYREKWGMKAKQPLVCKALQRERRQRMQNMKLWEKKNKPTN